MSIKVLYLFLYPQPPPPYKNKFLATPLARTKHIDEGIETVALIGLMFHTHRAKTLACKQNYFAVNTVLLSVSHSDIHPNGIK